MVKSIPIFKVMLSEGLVNQDAEADKLFGYCIEANKGPVGKPELITSSSEAKRKFGVNFAPHFYQKGAGIVVYRVGFKETANASITYKAYIKDYPADTNETKKDVDILKITAVDPGTPEHKVNLTKSLTSSSAYTLTVTIEDVGSKKYQNISSLTDVVKRINSKFGDYLHAELLLDEDKLLGKANITGENKLTADKSLIYDSTAENPYSLKATSEVVAADNVVSEGIFQPSRLHYNKDSHDNVIDTLSGGSNGKLLKTNQETSNISIPANGLVVDTPAESVGTGDTDANIDTTLLYAYRNAFKEMEDVNLLGIATLSNAEVVQNELVAHIEKMIDPEIAKYRFGVTGFLAYPAKDSNGRVNAIANIGIDDLTESTKHIDNPFVMYIGQGAVFEEEGTQYNLLPHECVQLYTGIRSALDYNQSIFGGNPKKVLNGVVDVLPINTDGAEIYKEDRELLNESGVMTFLKKYKEVRFLQGVTTAQDSPVLSHESIMSIVLYVLRRLVEVAWPFLGETLTEDIKSGFAQAISDELKRITDTDNSLMALEDYNIPPYDVEIRATTVTGFNEAGELVRETKLAAIIKIVPRGSIEAIELSVMVI